MKLSISISRSLAIGSLVMIILTGCPAGIAPIVGYPSGKNIQKPEIICSSGTDLKALRLYEQLIRHEYNLQFSPEGGREHYPLKTEHRYYVQIGSAPMRELDFLRTGPSRGASFDHVYYIGETDRWVGYGLCKGAPIDDSSFDFLPGADEGANQSSRYFITVFDQTRIISRREVVTMARRPTFQFIKRIPAIQFNSPSGRMAYLINTDSVVKAE